MWGTWGNHLAGICFVGAKAEEVSLFFGSSPAENLGNPSKKKAKTIYNIERKRTQTLRVKRIFRIHFFVFFFFSKGSAHSHRKDEYDRYRQSAGNQRI